MAKQTKSCQSFTIFNPAGRPRYSFAQRGCRTTKSALDTLWGCSRNTLVKFVAGARHGRFGFTSASALPPMVQMALTSIAISSRACLRTTVAQQARRNAQGARTAQGALSRGSVPRASLVSQWRQRGKVDLVWSTSDASGRYLQQPVALGRVSVVNLGAGQISKLRIPITPYPA